MNCPNCGKELELRSQVAHNVNAYGKAVLAEALCCGRPVMVSDVPTIRVDAVQTNRTTDDWGYKFKNEHVS
jgi:hypothetical protein